MAKLLVTIVVCSCAHFGQFFIPHTLDFLVVLATAVKQLSRRTRCKTTAVKYISTIALCSVMFTAPPFYLLRARTDCVFCQLVRMSTTARDCHNLVACSSAGVVCSWPGAAAGREAGSIRRVRKCLSPCWSRAPPTSLMWRDLERVIPCVWSACKVSYCAPRLALVTWYCVSLQEKRKRLKSLTIIWIQSGMRWYLCAFACVESNNYMYLLIPYQPLTWTLQASLSGSESLEVEVYDYEKLRSNRCVVTPLSLPLPLTWNHTRT